MATMLPVLCAAAVDPPAERYRRVTRYFHDGPAFALIQNSRPAFRLTLSDPGNPILDTAARDLRRYFADRSGSGPQIASSLPASGNVIARDPESRYPLSGGLCYTMTPALNVLNQFACAEGFWNPAVTEDEVMKSYTEGVLGKSDPWFTEIFPWFDIAPMVGYTFHNAAAWTADYAAILRHMTRAGEILAALQAPAHARFRVYPAPPEPWTRAAAQAHLQQLPANERARLQTLLASIDRADMPAMKRAYQRKHYRLFLDYPTEFTPLLPGPIDGFFRAFGGDFVN